MLVQLRIKNLVLARDVLIDFAPGLNLITGETGAGKSLVAGALGLVSGARAEAGLVRQGTDRATVEALFDLSRRPEVTKALTQAGYESDGELLVRRELSPDGRSRAFIGDSSATLASLRSMVGGLLELHGQHEPQSLLQPEYHRELLDRYGGHQEWTQLVRLSALRMRELSAGIQEHDERAAQRESRLETLRYRLEEFEQVAPEAGEESRLRAERDRLRHAEEIGQAARSALELIYENEDAALDQVHAAARRLRAQSAAGELFEELADRLDEIRTELSEIAGELRSEGDELVPDPGRLGEIEDRLVAIERLRRRFDGAPLEDVITSAEVMLREIDQLAELDDAAAESRQKLDAEWAEYKVAAGKLQTARQAASDRLGKQVAGSLAELAMAKARLDVQLTSQSTDSIDPEQARTTGLEDVEFLLQANPGEPARPLRKVASGGEISRLMLALDMALEKDLPARTLLFDEVDQGLGGDAAERLGVFLARLSGFHQVICITHLPQVASRAESHVTVAKKVRGGRTVAVVKVLKEEEDRVEELARMLGGRQITPVAYRHAAEMIRGAQEGEGAV